MADCLLHVARSHCRDDFSKEEMGKQPHSIQSAVWIWSSWELDVDDDCKFSRICGWCGWTEEHHSWHFQRLFRYVLLLWHSCVPILIFSRHGVFDRCDWRSVCRYTGDVRSTRSRDEKRYLPQMLRSLM